MSLTIHVRGVGGQALPLIVTMLGRRAADIMTPAPKTVTPDLLASAALEMINASKITALFVVENGRPVGIIHIHDLLRAGVA